MSRCVSVCLCVCDPNKGLGFRDPDIVPCKDPTVQGAIPLRVQVPNYHILSKIVTYITTIRNLST